jgi:hypothetical protein
MDTPVFDALTNLLLFDCLKPIVLELSCSGIVAPTFSLERHVYGTRGLAFSGFN